MSLEYVQKLAGSNPNVEIIYDKVEDLLLERLMSTGIESIPRSLDYIVEEVTLRRFNMVGSEGMKSESVGGHSVTFDERGLFTQYEKAINDYIVETTGKGQKDGVVYFL